MFRSESLGYSTSSATDGTAVTGGTTHTKGTWTTIGTLSQDCNEVNVRLHSCDSSSRLLTDIRIGGDTIAEDIYCVSRTSSYPAVWQTGPIPLKGKYASGDTLQVRVQPSNAGAVCIFTAEASFNPFMAGGGNHANYGSDTSNTTAEQIDPGASANTESSVVELTDSGTGLEFDTDLILLSMANNDQTVSGGEAICRLYYDATGSTDSGKKGLLYYTSAIDTGSHHLTPMRVDRRVWTEGTRIWASLQSTDTTSGDRNIDISFNAWDYARV